MKNIILIVSVLFTSWLTLGSFAAEVKQPVLQKDKFEVELSATEKWMQTEDGKAVATKVAPQMAAIRQAYNDTLVVEREVKVLLSSAVKDSTWMDQVAAMSEKILALQEKLPTTVSSTKKKYSRSGVDGLPTAEEMSTLTGDIICITYSVYLLERTMESLTVLQEAELKILQEERV